MIEGIYFFYEIYSQLGIITADESISSENSLEVESLKVA